MNRSISPHFLSLIYTIVCSQTWQIYLPFSILNVDKNDRWKRSTLNTFYFYPARRDLRLGDGEKKKKKKKKHIHEGKRLRETMRVLGQLIPYLTDSHDVDRVCWYIVHSIYGGKFAICGLSGVSSVAHVVESNPFRRPHVSVPMRSRAPSHIKIKNKKKKKKKSRVCRQLRN